ncbi:unnamed protein product [Toxocara canis]|uniref:Type II toxin-antitoxin system RelE/ParE family toxin n=1 Tax=Toxocara canis TaxID=6265 RepID=A0A183UN66_TOXCA|nr:unnamed protein product [Toxocara canis]
MLTLTKRSPFELIRRSVRRIARARVERLCAFEISALPPPTLRASASEAVVYGSRAVVHTSKGGVFIVRRGYVAYLLFVGDMGHKECREEQKKWRAVQEACRSVEKNLAKSVD